MPKTDVALVKPYWKDRVVLAAGLVGSDEVVIEQNGFDVYLSG